MSSYSTHSALWLNSIRTMTRLWYLLASLAACPYANSLCIEVHSFATSLMRQSHILHLRYHIRATGTLHGSGAVSSATVVSLICVTGDIAGFDASLIRAALAFDSAAPASSAAFLRFRPRFPLPLVSLAERLV
ncbi:hypothetical protein K469DRAFT_76499 [Zopfia rhizophila CBS 207.26]|uniref:Uncharacterized protein n=1 Tax=Zopfia rhizophila CBS 207.26 TaxID=1314779 RepID=A0A6A6EGV7_9PEZI|nr:hypothetical protein K469DRAFT_76499 [Zopfia rhizophila CBS 207.26]